MAKNPRRAKTPLRLGSIAGVCGCGAVHFSIDGKEYCCGPEYFGEHFRLVGRRASLDRVTQRWANCNHCVNHWGLDLCACGSGAAPAACEEGFPCCGDAMQSIEEGRTKYVAPDSLAYFGYD